MAIPPPVRVSQSSLKMEKPAGVSMSRIGVELSLSHVSAKKAMSATSVSIISAISVACLTANLQFNRTHSARVVQCCWPL